MMPFTDMKKILREEQGCGEKNENFGFGTV